MWAISSTEVSHSKIRSSLTTISKERVEISTAEDVYVGILLVDSDAAKYNPNVHNFAYMLVVEKKGDWFERVGCCWCRGYLYNLVRRQIRIG